MDFQHRLYQLRREHGLSQEKLAGRLGVTRQAVQKWEAGASRPDMDNLLLLAQTLDVSLDWLVTGREEAEAVRPPEPAPAAGRLAAGLFPCAMSTAAGVPCGGCPWCI
jgi:transcriptional regulator with XRE-family HTH domain